MMVDPAEDNGRFRSAIPGRVRISGARSANVQPDPILGPILITTLMSARIRHCVECPKCLTRYLIAFSPYRNGSYLLPTVVGSSEEYTLHCFCRRPSVVSRWRWSEVKTCEVSKAAYDRGYGTAEETAQVNSQPRSVWSFDITRYLNLKPMEKERNSR
jgi:hypothetical protein